MVQISNKIRYSVMILSFVYAGVCAFVLFNSLYLWYDNYSRNEPWPMDGSNISGAEPQSFQNGTVNFRMMDNRGVPRTIELSTVILFALVGMIISGGAGFTLHDMITRKDRKEMRDTVINEMLCDDEKNIVRLLEKNDGELKQSELVMKSGLSKLKVSRIIKKLEMMNVVKKHPYGVTNKVVLEKRFVEEK